ncbi:nuclear transport factor 2 family protein [Flavobacteriaceae bacterium TK19130]|nr:nuclear transport factor 2 family protein [Thermobacterium salinum]
MRTLLFLLCMAVPLSQQAQSVTDQVLAQNRAMETAYNAGNLTKIADYYTKDGLIIGPQSQVEGHEAIVNYWTGQEGRHVDWELETIELLEYGEAVVQRGISHLRYYYNEEIVQSDVRFTLLWVKEDGQWKIKIDHYTPL